MNAVQLLMKECNTKSVDNYFTLNREMGCKEGGFGPECKYCIALHTAVRESGEKGKMTNIYRKTIKKAKGEYLGHSFNGKIIKNPYWDERIYRNPRKDFKNYLVTYQGDVALWSVSGIYDVYRLAYEYPKHTFTFLTKIPSVLYKKTQVCVEKLRSEGIDITKCLNIIHGTSVGMNRAKKRIEYLKSFYDLGFDNLEVWHKPLLEDITGVNYNKIKRVRINAEKGKRKRIFNPQHALNVINRAKKAGVEVCFDMEKKVLEKTCV